MRISVVLSLLAAAAASSAAAAQTSFAAGFPARVLAAHNAERARVPLERMLEMAGRTVGQGDVGRPIVDHPEDIDPAISGD